MLLVQEYLETHTFAELAAEYGVYASFSKSGHKFSLNYDQLESKESDILSQQCRGCILTCNDGRSLLPEANLTLTGRTQFDHICPGKTSVMCCGMFRFFNYGQGAAANINFNDPNIAIMEKMDGTLCLLHYDNVVNEWYVATRSCPEADIEIDSGFYTFRTLFEKALFETIGLCFDGFTSKLNKNITYCFELTSPFNTIVVKYPNARLTFLAARNILTMQELNPADVYVCGVPVVRVYMFTCVSDIVEWVSSRNPLEHEGVVVKDSNYNRVKIKNASYVAFSRARDVLGSSERNCLELILQGKEDDVIPALPQEIVDRILNIKNNLLKMINKYDEVYMEIKNKAELMNAGDRKTFALLVKERSDLWGAPFFMIYSNKATDMKDYLIGTKKSGTWADNFLDQVLKISKIV